MNSNFLRSSNVIISTLVVGTMVLAGCSGIRVVKANKAGGEIALIGNREDAMEKARLEMARTCGGPQNYEVMEEGETVVGQTTQTSGSQQTESGQTWSGRPATRTTGNSTQETRDATEWRVKYSCKGAAVAAAPATDGTPVPAPAPAPAPSPGSQIHELVIRY